MRYDLVCFDLDGTLVDSLPDIAGALNRSLVSSGGVPVSLEVVRSLVGDGVVRLAERALALQPTALTTTPVALAEAIKAIYTAEPCIDSKLYEGIHQVLSTIHKNGSAKQVVFTNKPGDVARALLSALKIDHFFSAIVGDGDGFPRKPDARGLWALRERFNVRLERVVMVGDGLPDMDLAQNARCASAAALWGYTDPALLRAKAPTFALAAPLELLASVSA